jgi:hypothetical protein
MPQQLIETGFTDCGSVRVSYNTSATPINSPPLDDAEGRYFLVDRADPALALKIVLEHTLASDPYNSFTVSYHETGSYQEFRQYDNPYRTEIVTLPIDETYQVGAYGRGRYARNANRSTNENYDDGGYRRETRKTFYCESYIQPDYDEDGDPIEVTIEPVGCEVSIASQARYLYSISDGSPNFLDSSSTSEITRLATLDGRAIDIDTGAVSDGWSIVVYEVYEWGDSELSRFRFDTDPQTVSAECLGDQLCDNGCIEFVIDENGAYNCICPDDDPALGLEPPIDPDIALEIPPRQQLHRERPKLKKAKATLAKSEQEYRETLGKIGQKEQELDDAVSQGDPDAEAAIKTEIESLVETGRVQAGKYQDLKNDYANDSQVLNDLTEAETQSGITVVPTGEGWRYPPITPDDIATPTPVVPNRGGYAWSYTTITYSDIVPPKPEVNVGGIFDQPIRTGIKL